ncbi:MAG TPA: hypothetical protein DDZ40_04510 [Deltaproteobacteria bacterium]|nr:hypothetical protein [Deltaproteobacteria bacterium]
MKKQRKELSRLTKQQVETLLTNLDHVTQGIEYFLKVPTCIGHQNVPDFRDKLILVKMLKYENNM